jgi:predicted DNA-binding protein with PD1-like motif
MQFQRFDDRYQLRFESGEQVSETLLRFLNAENIGFASMTGLGAIRFARVSYWNSATQQYETHELDEQLEVVSWVGNVTIKDEAPFVHAHISLGRQDLTLIGGHFNDAVVHPTLEIWLRPEADEVQRVLDQTCGLYVMDLPERA